LRDLQLRLARRNLWRRRRRYDAGDGGGDGPGGGGAGPPTWDEGSSGIGGAARVSVAQKLASKLAAFGEKRFSAALGLLDFCS